MQIGDNGEGSTESEAQLDEDCDASLELYIEVDVDPNANLDDCLDTGNDRSTKKKRISFQIRQRVMIQRTRFGQRR